MATTMTILGCASSGVSDVSSPNPRIENHVYGLLKSGSNGYEFERFALSLTATSSGQPWVRLTDNEPMWFTGTPSYCSETATRRPDSCSEDNETLFMEAEVDGSSLPKTLGVATFTMGLSLIAGLPYEPVFQESDFNDAVNDAREKLPNLNQKLQLINDRLNSEVSGAEAFQKQPQPKIEYRIANNLPDSKDSLHILDERSESYSQDFPKIRLTPQSEYKALLGINLVDTFSSLNELASRLPEPESLEFTYAIECEKPVRSALRLRYSCPESVPQNQNTLTVDFEITAVTVKDAELPPIRNARYGDIKLSYLPARALSWEVTNTSASPIKLTTMLVKFRDRSVTINLQKLATISPGATEAFNLDDRSKRRIKPSVLLTKNAKTEPLSYLIRLNYRTQGLGNQVAIIEGKTTVYEAVKTTATMESLNGNIFDRETLSERLNNP